MREKKWNLDLTKGKSFLVNKMQDTQKNEKNGKENGKKISCIPNALDVFRLYFLNTMRNDLFWAIESRWKMIHFRFVFTSFIFYFSQCTLMKWKEEVDFLILPSFSLFSIVQNPVIVKLAFWEELANFDFPDGRFNRRANEQVHREWTTKCSIENLLWAQNSKDKKIDEVHIFDHNFLPWFVSWTWFVRTEILFSKFTFFLNSQFSKFIFSQNSYFLKIHIFSKITFSQNSHCFKIHTFYHYFFRENKVQY